MWTDDRHTAIGPILHTRPTHHSLLERDTAEEHAGATEPRLRPRPVRCVRDDLSRMQAWDRTAPRKKQPPFLFSQVGLTAEGQAKAGYKHAYPARLDIGSSKTRSHTVSWKQALTTPDGKEPFHHVARGVDNAGPGQVDSATDADCTEVEGDPPSTQVSPQALP